MSQPLPLPPTGVPFINPATGSVDVQWQNYLLALDNSFNLNAAPRDARYWVSTANGELTNERNIGLLASGYLQIVTALGIATPSTVTAIPAADLSGSLFGVSVAAPALAYTDIAGLASGVYTPTLTSVANVAASTAFACQWLRVGATVTVSGQVAIDPTSATTLTQLGISLPVAANFTAAEQCGGTAATSALAGSSAAISADLTNDRAELAFTTALDVANRTWSFSFTYQIV